jgi:RNA polymerase sigma-70 factor, ECF subfamily
MEPTDIELMLEVRCGDVIAFGELARRYQSPLRRFFAALLADRSQAEDFAQETLLRLWLSRGQYEPTGKFSTYLFQIGKHYWLNQRKRASLRLTELETAAERAGGPSPEVVVLRRLRERRIHQAVADLPDLYRSVFRLCHLEGRTYAAAALELGVPVGTVRSRMSEALRRLRVALPPEEEE